MIGFPQGRVVDLSNPVSDHPLNYGLVSWWMGLPNNSGGSTLFDLVQTSRNNGTLTNGPTWVPGPNGFGAISFDGSDDYVDIPATTKLDITGAFTICGWMYPRSRHASFESTVMMQDDTTGGRRFRYVLAGTADGGNTGKQRWQYAPSAGTSVYSTTAVPLNEWSFIGLSSDATNYAFYLNAATDGSGTTNVTPTAGSTVSTQLGYLASLALYALDGVMGDWRIYNGRALSSAEMLGVYEQGLRWHPDTLRRVSSRVWSFPTPTTSVSAGPLLKLAPKVVDLGNPVSDHPLNQSLVSWWLGLPNNSGGSTLFDICQTGRNHGTLTNEPTWVPGPSGFQGLRLDRTVPSYVSLPSSFPRLSGDFTIVMDIQPSVVTGAADGYYLHSDWAFAGRNYLFQIMAGQLRLVNGDGGTNQDSECLGGSLTANQRVMVGATRSGSTFAVWINGVQVGSVTGSYTGGSTGNTRNLFAAGSPATTDSYSGDGYSGWAFTRALSASEIWSLYEQSLRGHPDTLRWVSSRVWSFAAEAGGTTYTNEPTGTITLSGSLVKSISQLKSITESITGALAKAATHPLVGSSTPSSSIAKTANKPHTGSVTGSGNETNNPNKGFTGSITPSGSRVSNVTQGLTGSVTPSGSKANAIAKSLTGLVTPSGSRANAVSKPLTGEVTPSGGISNLKAGNQSLTGSITCTGSTVTKGVSKGLTGSSTPSATLTKQVSKSLTVTATIVATLVKECTHLLSGGTLSSGGSIAKQVNKSTSGSVALSGSNVSSPVSISKGFTATITFVRTLVKAVAKLISGTITLSGFWSNDYDNATGLVGIENVTGYGPSAVGSNGRGPSITATARGNL